MKRLFITLLIFATLGFSGCVTFEQNPISGNKRAYGYTWQQELEIGRDADSEIVEQYGLYGNPELSKYVTELGEELLAVSHLRRPEALPEFKNTPFTFRVLDSPVVNAFALPGGYVYITRGLLAHLDNEAQLAVVLGHEIGHVAGRHASKRAAGQQFGQIAILGGAVVGQSLGLDGGDLLQMSSQAAQLLFLKYGRDDERESDKLGVEYSAKKGYEASEGSEFFTSLKRITEKEGVSIPSHLSTHPDPGEREQTIKVLASEWKSKGYEQSKLGTERFYSMIKDIPYGENPRNGFVENGVFYHPDLAFKFNVPSGFRVFNETSQVILVNDNQSVVTIFQIDSKNATPQASVEAFLRQEGIKTIERTAIKAGLYDGYRGVASVKSNSGGDIQLMLTAIKYQQFVFQFLSYTSAASYTNYSQAFALLPDSFSEVTDEKILNVLPVRLRQIVAEGGKKFEEYLPQALPMNISPLEIAIVNQVELNDVIEKGRILKIPAQY